MKRKTKILLTTLLFFGLVLFLSFNRHSKSGLFNYHSEVWADKAGYYMYLPATFHYGFNADSFPDSIDKQTGNGFYLNPSTNRIETKYTYGVALLQSPFYLAAHLIASKDDVPVGFSKTYQKSINVSAVFYGVLGLVFLGLFLHLYFPLTTVYWTLSILFLGSHLFYYTIDETGMAHVYLFFLFALLLYYWKKSQFLYRSSLWSKLGVGFVIGLILIIRPTSILFLLVLFLWEIYHTSTLAFRIKKIFQWNYLLPLFSGTFIAFIPQFIYWKHTFGHYIYFSYQQEGFNWFSPEIIATWFSPNNGLLLYTPLYFLILVGIVNMIRKKQPQGKLLGVAFVMISYIFSAWWDWGFGCSFGARSFVEYLVIFSFALAYIIQSSSSWSFFTKIAFSVIVLLLVSYNLKMTYSYDGCFHGDRNWDWGYYWKILSGPTK